MRPEQIQLLQHYFALPYDSPDNRAMRLEFRKLMPGQVFVFFRSGEHNFYYVKDTRTVHWYEGGGVFESGEYLGRTTSNTQTLQDFKNRMYELTTQPDPLMRQRLFDDLKKRGYLKADDRFVEGDFVFYRKGNVIEARMIDSLA